MYNIVDHADSNAGVREYVADTVAEVMGLSGDMGSSAFCFEDHCFYMKNGSGEWVKV